MALSNDRFTRQKAHPDPQPSSIPARSTLRPHRERPSLKLICVSSILALSTLFATSAFAQSASDKAAAESLFDEGVKLLKAGSFDKACKKLERSQSVDPGIGTLLYLGECYKKAGRTASAWATFREAASKADAVGETDRARTGRERANELEPHLSRVIFEMAEANMPIDGLTMLQGGIPVSRALWGSAVPVDPGELQIVVRAPGYESYEFAILVREDAAQASLTIPVLVKLPEKIVSQPTPQKTTNKIFAPIEPELPESGVSQRRAGLIVGGLGIVGLGVGGLFGALALVNENKAQELCQTTTCGSEQGVDKTNTALTFATVSTISFIAGGALLVGGIVLYSTAPAGHQRVGLELTPTLGGARLNMGGTF